MGRVFRQPGLSCRQRSQPGRHHFSNVLRQGRQQCRAIVPNRLRQGRQQFRAIVPNRLLANKVMMFWRLFMQGPQSRLAFPGVAAFYRGLYDGPADESSPRQDKQPQANPMLYVSRGPWSIYEILQEFFRIHRIPVGPILFLREWGLALQRPWPRRAEDHKLTLIREMLSLYDGLPFVLIGDSGQRDPEIYAQVVAEYPGRVAAVYIRDVSRSPQRRAAIEALAERVLADGRHWNW